MADENTTLLKFTGDASGAKAAALEAVSGVQANVKAMQELKAAEQAVASAQQQQIAGEKAAHAAATQLTETTREQGAALRDLAKESGLQQVQTEFEGLGKGAEDAGKKIKAAGGGTRAFIQIVSAVNPQLGEVIRTFHDLKEVGSGAFGTTGKNAMALGGVLVGVGIAVSAIVDAFKLAAQRAKEAVEQFETMQAKQLERRAGAGEQAGLHGVGDKEGRGAAQFYAKFLEENHISKGAAEQTAGALVPAVKSGMKISRDQMLDLATLQQRGSIHLTAGVNEEETVKNVTEAMVTLKKMPSKDRRSLLGGEQGAARQRIELLDAIKGGNEKLAAKYLTEEQGVSPGTAETQAPDFIRASNGEDPWPREKNVFGYRVDLIKGSPAYNMVRDQRKQMVPQFLQDWKDANENARHAQDRENAVPTPAAGVTEARPHASATPVKEWGNIFEHAGGGAPQTALPQHASPNVASAPPQINYHFNGPNSFTLPPKGRQSRTP